MLFGRDGKENPSLGRMKDVLAGDFRGQLRAHECSQNPPREATVEASLELLKSLASVDLGWLRAQVRIMFVKEAVKYEVDFGEVYQMMSDLGEYGNPEIHLEYRLKLKLEQDPERAIDEAGAG